jgi:hypothetical protein
MAQPFDREWSGITDAAGNLTVTLTPLAAYDSALVIAGQAQGNPIWAIFKNQNFLLPGAGAQIALGPVYFKAKETLKIQVQGGRPLTAVTGSIWGTQSTVQNGTDLPVLQPQTSGSIPTFSQQQLIDGPVVVQPATPVTHNNLPVPSGAHSLLLVQNPNVFPLSAGANVVGHQTGVQYINGVAGPALQFGLVASIVDTSLDVQYFNNSAAPLTQWLVAIMDPELISVISGTIQIVGSTGNQAQVIADGPASNFFALAVTMKGADAAPWQAPSKAVSFGVNLAAGASATLIAGVGGQSIYLFDITMENAAAVAAQFGQFESPAGTSIFQFATSIAWPPAGVHFSGVQLPVGAPLVIKNTSAVAAFVPQGGITYSQA